MLQIHGSPTPTLTWCVPFLPHTPLPLPSPSPSPLSQPPLSCSFSPPRQGYYPVASSPCPAPKLANKYQVSVEGWALQDLSSGDRRFQGQASGALRGGEGPGPSRVARKEASLAAHFLFPSATDKNVAGKKAKESSRASQHRGL